MTITNFLVLLCFGLFVFFFLASKNRQKNSVEGGKKNCVDYVAHTCAVPEGRAATENVGDRQEWFKTDSGASLSLLTPPTFWLGWSSPPPTSTLPPPPPHLLSEVEEEAKGKREGKEMPEGGNTEEDGRGRPTGHRPSTNTHTHTQDTPNFFSFFFCLLLLFLSNQVGDTRVGISLPHH